MKACEGCGTLFQPRTGDGHRAGIYCSRLCWRTGTDAKYRATFRERLEEKYEPEPTSGCWLWVVGLSAHGYGRVTLGTRRYQAHRVTYEMARGPIPAGLELDHLCRVRSCVNPAHLEPVTNLENIRRGVRGQPTECRRGHPVDAANTRIAFDGSRICRTCNRFPYRSRTHRRARLAAALLTDTTDDTTGTTGGGA